MLSFSSLYSLQTFTLLRMALPAQPKISIFWASGRPGLERVPSAFLSAGNVCLLVLSAKESRHACPDSPAQLMSKYKFGLHKIPVYLLIPISGNHQLPIAGLGTN